MNSSDPNHDDATEFATAPALILASGSPRRRELLRALGVEIKVVPADIDEDAIREATHRQTAIATARAKAEEAARKIASAIAQSGPEGEARKAGADNCDAEDGEGDNCDAEDDEAAVAPRDAPDVFAAAASVVAASVAVPILAADTMVIFEGRALGKPRDRDDAREMLRALSGATHEVITGVVVRTADGKVFEAANVTQVAIRELSEAAIESYLATGGADDKAGAYGIQEVGPQFVAGVNGDLSNVIGLPLVCVRRVLKEATGREWFADKPLADSVATAFPVLLELDQACWRGIRNFRT